MQAVMTPEFLKLKEEIESHPRLCGYYLIKLVSIAELRARSLSDEEIAELVFRDFDDQEWPPDDQRPTDQSWADYIRDRNAAFEHTVEALVGGGPIGHTHVTIERPLAEVYFSRFEALFDEPRSYYTGMGFGDPEQVLVYGVSIISRTRAGLLWIAESD